MERDPDPITRERTLQVLVGGGFVAGLIGLLASSCCALPLALAGIGMASVAGSIIPTLAVLREPFLVLAAGLALCGWIFALRRRRARAHAEACAPRMRVPDAVALALWLLSGVVAVAIVWPTWIEPFAIGWVR